MSKRKTSSKRLAVINPGYGKAFTFHGSFTSKILARRREKEIPGSFIEERDGRYYVLKPKRIRTAKTSNPPRGAVKIYDKALRIEAMKKRPHMYGGKTSRSGQKYYHDFESDAEVWGLPDGSLLIRAKK